MTQTRFTSPLLSHKHIHADLFARIDWMLCVQPISGFTLPNNNNFNEIMSLLVCPGLYIGRSVWMKTVRPSRSTVMGSEAFWNIHELPSTNSPRPLKRTFKEDGASWATKMGIDVKISNKYKMNCGYFWVCSDMMRRLSAWNRHYAFKSIPFARVYQCKTLYLDIPTCLHLYKVFRLLH